MIDAMTIPSSATPTAHAPSRAAEMPAEHRQFDFWIGNWDVFGVDGNIAGNSRIETVSEGYGISEHWTGARGSRGVSYNACTSSGSATPVATCSVSKAGSSTAAWR